MATASPVLSEDQLTCSICLEVFTEPVSTPCGHNFCYACIVRHWEGKEQCKCPLCNENLDKGLKFCVNTGFKEVVENFKKHLETADKHSSVKPGEVACDCCVGNTSRASKTCWVCLTSYCETHLEPHQRVASLKRHKLTNPVRNLEDNICQKHNRILELCGSNDLSRVCVLCAGNSDRDRAPLQGPYVDKRAQVVEKNAEVMGKRGKRAKKSKVAVQTEKKGKMEVLANDVEPVYVPGILFPNEGPHLLNAYYRLPENRGISYGKFYYEVETKGRRRWLIGLVRESCLRKGRAKLNPRDGNLVIQVENTNCTVLGNVHLNLLLTRTPERVTVFVDYDKGLVTFCDDNKNLIYTFTGCKFKERMFLLCCSAEDPRRTEGLQKCKYILLAFFSIFAINFILRWLLWEDTV